MKTRVNTLTDPEKLKVLAIPSVLYLPCLVILLTLYFGILEACLKAIKLPQCHVAAESPRFALVTVGFAQFSGKALGSLNILHVHCGGRGKGGAGRKGDTAVCLDMPAAQVICRQ